MSINRQQTFVKSISNGYHNGESSLIKNFIVEKDADFVWNASEQDRIWGVILPEQILLKAPPRPSLTHLVEVHKEFIIWLFGWFSFSFLTAWVFDVGCCSLPYLVNCLFRFLCPTVKRSFIVILWNYFGTKTALEFQHI